MKAIVTTVGQDQVGIIAGVSHYLSTAQINILDVSQTIMSGYFTMMMMVEVPADQDFTKLAADLRELGTQLGVKMNIRNERICQSMPPL